MRVILTSEGAWKMLEALVITLREGIEAALVIGIILAYLRRTGRSQLNRYVYGGLIAALTVSLAGGIAFQVAGIDPENKLVEGILYFAAAIFVGGMVIWMWRTGKNMRHEIEGQMSRIVGRNGQGGGFGLAASTFFMVGREGIETVLFLAALSLSSRADSAAGTIFRFTGGLLGLGLAVAFAVAFIRGSVRIDLKKFFAATNVVLVLLVLRLFVGGLHEWGEVQIIPLTPAVMKAIGLLVRDSSTVILTMLLLTVPIFMVLLDRKDTRLALVDGESPEERRKKLAQIRNERNWRIGIIGFALAIDLVLGLSLISAANRSVFDSSPTAIAASTSRRDGGPLRSLPSRVGTARFGPGSTRAGSVSLQTSSKPYRRTRPRYSDSRGARRRDPRVAGPSCTIRPGSVKLL